MASTSKGELRKTDILKLEDSSGNITRVIAPNNLQVGLDDSDFLSTLTVKGSVIAQLGITGSITQVSPGVDFLQSGTNISIVKNSNGSLTIGSTGFPSTEDLTISNGLQLSAGSTYDGSSAVTLTVDPKTAGGLISEASGISFSFSNVPTAHSSLGLANYIVVDNGSAVIKKTIGDILALGSPVTIGNAITLGSGIKDSVGAAGSWNNSAAITLAVDYASNGALNSTGTQIYVDPNSATATTTIDKNNDYAIIYDADAGATRKTLLKYIVGLTTSDLTLGNGLTPNGTTFDGSAPVTIAVNPADTTIQSTSSGIRVLKVPSALSHGQGITTFSYDGSSTSQIQVDLSSAGGLNFNGSNEVKLDLNNLPAGPVPAMSNEISVAYGPNDTRKIDITTLGSMITTGINSSTVWTDGRNKAYTTSSIVISPAGGYASTYGLDNYFYISGSIGDTTDSAKISVFDCDTVTSGSITSFMGLSGSLTRLHDNSSYIVAGPGITVASSSNGQITITGNVGDITGITAGTGLTGGGTSGDINIAIDNSIVATLTGSQFSGNVGVTGSIGATTIMSAPAFSGSLTQLQDGSSYLREGTNVTITSSSAGHITVSSTNTNTTYTAGTGLDLTATEFSVDNSIVATLTGSQFSGNIGATGSIEATSFFSGSMFKAPILSGSLTKLHDGSSYLVAGNNITIVTGSSGAVTIAGASSMTTVSGSTSITDVSTINFSNAGIIQDLGSGDIAITSSIGVPEDGTYSDGLFTDFGEATPVGTAVDRFNEVLKALAPSPAPSLDDLNSKETGVTTLLSFGASNNQQAATPPYFSVASSAGLQSAVDVNGSYTVVTSSNNIRIATFTGTTHISGVLNADVSSNSQGNNIQNYPFYSFGDGDSGILKLIVNGSTIKEVDLTSNLIGSGTSGLGTGSYVDASGSGFIFLSTATTGTFSNGNPFNSFKHRTGQYVVAHQSQRDGWNYAQIQHIRTGSTQTTNYVEWVNDSNSDALTTAGESISFIGSGSADLSGITYYRSGTATYKVRVANAYKYTYDNNNITFNTANSAAASSSPTFSLSSQFKPSIDTGAGETQDKVLHLTGSSTVNATYFLSGAVTASVNVTSPLKSNLSAGGPAVVGKILMYNSTDTNTAIAETFMSESYRLQSGSFDIQAAVIDASYDWNSSIHMTGSNTNYLNGLQYYRDRLYSPLNTTNGGDFSTFVNGPTNPDYSGISGLRTFYRKFQNTSGAPVRDISYLIAGNGIIEDAGTVIGANNKFRVFFKLPSNGTNNSGWMDAASAFTYNETGNREGCYIGTFTDTVGTTNYVTWGTGSIANNEFIVAKVEADASWTGYIDSMTVSFGAVGSVIAAPNVNNLDVNAAGTGAELSFGSSLALAEYTNVGTTAGNSAVDANGIYNVSGNRYGVYGPTITSRVGTINETTTSPGNSYPVDAFGGGNANTGSLKLEVNGAIIQTTDLATFINGSDLNGDGSGFTLTTATPGEDNSELPDYTKFYRTGIYTVVSASQVDGWNYARVTHTVTGSDYESTYVEWVNDISNPSISLSDVTIGSFGSATSSSLSGIKYFISPSGSFRMRTSNIYKYVYSSNSNAISFPTTTNSTITSITGSGPGVNTAKTASTYTTLPNLNTGIATAYDYDLFITGAFSFDRPTSIPGGTAYTATVSGRVNHPLKGNTTTSSAQSNKVLAATISDTSTTTSESFTGEAKRLISGSYTTQANVTDGANTWDSAISLNGINASYNTGLAVYNGELASPQNIGLSGDEGDFRDVSEGGQLEAPAGNPDYSSLTNSTRDYIRSFTQTLAGSKSGFDVTITGTGTITSSGTNLVGSNNFNVFFKLPQTSAGFSTGWMDLATAFATGQYGDDAGCLSGGLTSNIASGATNTATLGVKSVDQSEYIVVKIVTDKTWTGNIESMSVSWA